MAATTACLRAAVMASKDKKICDDSNTEDDDGCLSTCAPARCGDDVQRLNRRRRRLRSLRRRQQTQRTCTAGCQLALRIDGGVTCSPSRRVRGVR